MTSSILSLMISSHYFSFASFCNYLFGRLFFLIILVLPSLLLHFLLLSACSGL